MRIHLIKKQSIDSFVRKNIQSRSAFVNWYLLLKYADWKVPEDIVKTFKTADILGNGSNRVVFNIGGNKYRMICKYYFGNGMVHLFVKWIGTHADYDKVCKDNRQYSIDIY